MFGSFVFLYGLFVFRQSDSPTVFNIAKCLHFLVLYFLLEALDLTAFPAAIKLSTMFKYMIFLKKQTGPPLQQPSLFPLLFLYFGGLILLSIYFSPFALNSSSPPFAFPSKSSESAELFHQLNMQALHFNSFH